MYYYRFNEPSLTRTDSVSVYNPQIAFSDNIDKSSAGSKQVYTDNIPLIEDSKDRLHYLLQIKSGQTLLGPTVPVPPSALIPDFAIEFWFTVNSGSFSAPGLFVLLGLSGRPMGDGFELLYDNTNKWVQCKINGITPNPTTPLTINVPLA